MDDEDARLVAESLVLADLRGVHSHGLLRLPVYVERIQRGVLDPRAKVRIVRETPAAAVLDAANGHGIPAGVKAMDVCIAKARRCGVGVAAVRRSNHFGIGWYFVRRAVQQGMVGVACSNADALVAPWGARKAYLGTNPLAVGIPAGEEPPVAVDMATSAGAHGRIVLARERGETIPPGWALDENGRPTTDPEAALAGTLLPFGGAKGSAIGLVIDLLCGPLAGALTGPHIAPLYSGMDRPQGLGHLFLAIDVGAFADPREFARQVDESIRAVRALPPAEGFERVQLPGEPEWRKEERRRNEGVVLPPGVVKALEDLERRLGLPAVDA
ncbi:MAG: Ldh family oxidoreductase [Firmicutes bacterium]|nr:Ldh family oxidoreductase [Bacillota bacterium]